MKNLSNKDLEWLVKPNDLGDEKRMVHIQDDFAIGFDAFRLHAIGLDKISEEEIEGIPIKSKAVDRFNDNVIIESININACYLLDALVGMRDNRQPYKSIKLSVAINKEDDIIAICLEDEERTAVVMCLREDGENE